MSAFFLGITFTGTVQADETPVALFCQPEQGKADQTGTFLETKGETSVMSCEVSNRSDDQEFSLFVLGSRITERSESTSSGTDLILKGGETAKVTLSFPAVFQGGSYGYTFSAIDKQSKAVVSLPSYLMGSLKEEKQAANIKAVSFDKEQYAWEAPFELQVALDVSNRDLKKNPVMLRVALKDAAGGECTIVSENTLVSGEEEKLNLSFPKEGTCVNGMTVSLHDEDGAVLDQKTLAVPLPMKKVPGMKETGSAFRLPAVAMLPLPIKVGLVLTGFLLLVITAWYTVNRKKKRRF